MDGQTDEECDPCADRQQQGGNQGGGKVIDHDAPTLGKVLKTSDGPGFPDIEETEEEEGGEEGGPPVGDGTDGRKAGTGDHPVEGVTREGHGQGDDLVDDNGRGIGMTEETTGAGGDGNGDH